MIGSRTARALIALVAVSLIPILAPCPALAEERKNSVEINLFGGTTFMASELALPNSAQYGARLGWNFTPVFAIEFQWLRADDDRLESADSTLIGGSVPVFNSDPNRTFGYDSYTLRFLINPGNERRRFKPYFVAGLGTLEITADPDLAPGEASFEDDVVFSIGGGIRHRLSPHMSFRAEFETQNASSESFHNESLNVGISWIFGGGSPEDSDRDGVLDLNDRCPDTPKGALIDKHDGCPWDLDQDGVLEGIDKCADTRRGWPVDEKGCPLDSDSDAVPDGTDDCSDTPRGAIVDDKGCPIDSDGDSILDGFDRCPDTPAGAIVDATDGDNPGCPHDSDDDGVVDGVDQCAITPPGATVDERGCPQDSDGDRILDGLDQCPETPEGGKIDRDGCPRVRLDLDEPQILLNVKFLRGTELYPGTEAWIMLLVDALHYWSDVTIELGVYTDSTGTKAGNLQVARRRAEVLREWLVERGIDRNRLQIKGYGAVKFIADNDTETGQRENRRVEVRYLQGDLDKHEPPPPPPPAPTPEEQKAPTGEEPASGEASAEDEAAEEPGEAGAEDDATEEPGEAGTEDDAVEEPSEAGAEDDAAEESDGGEESDPVAESPDTEESAGDDEGESRFRAAAHRP